MLSPAASYRYIDFTVFNVDFFYSLSGYFYVVLTNCLHFLVVLSIIYYDSLTLENKFENFLLPCRALPSVLLFITDFSFTSSHLSRFLSDLLNDFNVFSHYILLCYNFRVRFAPTRPIKIKQIPQNGDGYLNFTQIRREHSGWYKCTSRHLNFQYSSIGYFLNIRCKLISFLPIIKYTASCSWQYICNTLQWFNISFTTSSSLFFLDAAVCLPFHTIIICYYSNRSIEMI